MELGFATRTAYQTTKDQKRNSVGVTGFDKTHAILLEYAAFESDKISFEEKIR